jgi:xanthine dehydrogenase accessory factor
MWRLLENTQKLIDNKHSVCLVTLVEAKGSTYRRPGAKMVVGSNDYVEGAISGGCLEQETADYARQVIEAKQNKVIHYELDDDVIFGLGLGCGGSISLLLETGVERWLPQLLSVRTGAVVVKLIESEGNGVEPGTVCVYQDGRMIWENPDHELDMNLIHDHCQKSLDTRYPAIMECTVGGHKARLFLDTVFPPYSLIVFGGGDDAVPVTSFAIQLGFEVTVVDHRPVNLLETRFTQCKKVKWQGRQTTADLQIDSGTAVMVMSHHIQRDAEALEAFIETPAYYVGLLGPKKRLSRMQEHLTTAQVEDLSQNERLFSPVGLDIGSETPEEIAVSILTEMIAIRNKQSGGILRGKTHSIHKQSDQS